MPIQSYFDIFIDHLKAMGIPFSSNSEKGIKRIQVGGISVELTTYENHNYWMIFSISSIKLDVSFDIISGWFEQCSNLSYIKLSSKLNEGKFFRGNREAVSALIFSRLDIFSIIENCIGRYRYKTLEFELHRQYIEIHYNIATSKFRDIFELFNVLYSLDFIEYKES